MTDIATPPKKRRLTAKGMKEKGARFERDLAAHIQLATGLATSRTPLSGGGAALGLAGGADLTGTPGIHVEAKRCERLDFPGWLRQAENAIARTGAPEAPVVVNRTNRQSTSQSLVCMRLDHFLLFYDAWLRREGFVK